MGPALAPKAYYRWSCMGLEPAPWNATDGLARAQGRHQIMLPMILHGPHASPHSMLPMIWHGPVLATQHAANGLVWAQHWPQSMQLMVLHGPSAGRKVCYR